MEHKFLKRNSNKRLLLLFAGWGSDACLFTAEPPEGYDFLLCYDYTTAGLDSSLLKEYESIVLIGWSLGVWAAEEFFSSLKERRMVEFEYKIALNGTPFPKDDLFGIPKAVFEGTLKNFSPFNLLKFRKRMCGSREELNYYNNNLPLRDESSLYKELVAINCRVGGRKQGSAGPFWDFACIGERDLIFPAANQLACWEERGVKSRLFKGAAHYDHTLFEKLIHGDIIWKRR